MSGLLAALGRAPADLPQLQNPQSSPVKSPQQNEPRNVAIDAVMQDVATPTRPSNAAFETPTRQSSRGGTPKSATRGLSSPKTMDGEQGRLMILRMLTCMNAGARSPVRRTLSAVASNM